MSQRRPFDPAKYPDILQAMLNLTVASQNSKLEPALLELVKIRVSQINGCGFCLDMHTKDAVLEGETPQRIYLLSCWRETSLYSERERAALAWAEAVTRLENRRVPDDVYEQARTRFDEEELMRLTLAVIAINGWNRFNLAYNRPAGTYKAGSLKAMLTPSSAA
jgi:AhpD family alkylhydroperoxidase